MSKPVRLAGLLTIMALVGLHPTKEGGRMERVQKRVEFVANILIIVAALLVAFVIFKDHILTSGKSAAVDSSALTPAVGGKVSLPDVDWAQNSRTLVLAVSPGCHFCEESAPLYRQIVQRTSGRDDIRLVALLPVEAGEGAKNAEYLGIPLKEIPQAQFKSMGIAGTPTLLLVDGNATIQAVWFGKLSAEQEADLLRRIECHECG